MEQAQLDQWFRYHTPTQAQITAFQDIRQSAKIYAETVNKNVPDCADKTAAMRKIRDSVMAANLAIVCFEIPNDTIEKAAQAAHEANRVLCFSVGDNSQPKWEDAEEWQRKSAISGVLQVLSNPSVSAQDLHESWMAEKKENGWIYGPVKNAVTKEHPAILPYDQLPREQRLKDELFCIVVRSSLGL